MNRKFIVAILLVVAVPVCAQAQSPSAPKVTKADAQKVVKIISGNKAKTQTYCDMAKLFNQIERAGEKNIKKTAELNRKLDELAKRLGPEYAALVSGIPNVKPNSQEGQEISSTLAALDSLCAK
jgi:peptidoglycan hydrolase CwlO-like protein